MKWISASVIMLLSAGLMANASAGTLYEVICPEPGCGFKTSFDMYGGMTFDQVQGFCRGCGKSVRIAWERGRDEKKPPPQAEFWDPATGETMRLYKCPECGGVFVPVEKIEDFRHCPKCGKASLKHNTTLLYD